ncbi:NACHT domain-containing protein, partial [Streptomyces sp. FH025]|uniref:NACHT domain-containing protein n=1 Tax=Streptomyces sp. FH025 TaxID=2815937 RepID=UPI0027DAC6D8
MAWFVIHYGPTAGILAGAVGGLVGLLGLPAALRGALRLGGKPPESVPLDKVADGLALGVRRQWEAEVQVRRVNDPSPLPVAWTAADADLVESWSGLRELAENWPGGPPGDPAGWATGAWGLAGKGGEIDKVFSERVPTRRLVVLGEPGSGKTMLLIRLLLALLARRPEGGPVPVLFSLASWDPTRQDLDTWMAGQLTRDHPALRAPAPAELEQSSPGTRAHALLEQRLITPILDGLDELPPGLQVLALDALNGSLPARQPLVLSSRTTDYRNATATVRLHGAAGIRLLPLDSTSATVYLQRDADGPGAEAATRWSGIAASL